MKPETILTLIADDALFSVDIDIRAEGWLKALDDPDTLCRQALNAAMSRLELPPRAYEVSVVLTDDAEQETLNRSYRGRDSSTNVLSFPSDEMATAGFPDDLPMPLGDISLALETLVREAQDTSLRDHFCHLLVHGMLHLSGYDHETNDQAECMEALEISILEELGVDNPYTDSDDTIQD